MISYQNKHILEEHGIKTKIEDEKLYLCHEWSTQNEDGSWTHFMDWRDIDSWTVVKVFEYLEYDESAIEEILESMWC